MARNTDQNVGDNYAKHFDEIFRKEPSSGNSSGRYVLDSKSGKLIKVDSNIPSSIKTEMESKTSMLNRMGPITIQKGAVTG